MRKTTDISLFNRDLIKASLIDSFLKLNPLFLRKRPIILIVEICAFLTAFSLFLYKDFVVLQISLWLWFTVLFSNFAESIAESRGKARANTFKNLSSEVLAKRLKSKDDLKNYETVEVNELKIGDLLLVEVGDTIPTDGEVVSGIATVNETAITGEPEPVIREGGSDKSAVTAGTKIVSDYLVIRVTAKQGESYIDKVIHFVETANRQATPTENSLNILLYGFTGVFLIVTVSLLSFANYLDVRVPFVFLVALFITLVPTTIAGLLPAIGISGMDRLIKYNIIAKSGRAIEAASDIDILLLDKTGTITYGNRLASEFLPMPGVKEEELAEAAYLSSIYDDTPEGRSIVKLAKNNFNFEERRGGKFVEFTAKTQISGINFKDIKIRKGASEAILQYISDSKKPKENKEIKQIVEKVSNLGGTPLVVAKNKIVLGVIYLKDVIKPGLKERFEFLKRMGIKTVMITGDNLNSASVIAAEAGVDDVISEATPEKKLDYIRKAQEEGYIVAMCGDGSNDALALAQADIGMAMNNSTQPAREASNMIDLDNNPTKLIEVVMIGKQLLISRGALTTFSLANDIAKYFAIIPALFIGYYPELQQINIMRLSSANSAILSAIIFNALIVITLIPLALKGVNYKQNSVKQMLNRNLLIYGLGGVITPFIGIKFIDFIITTLSLV
jgi:K+-transporting ATPase ATPase B chain